MSTQNQTMADLMKKEAYAAQQASMQAAQAAQQQQEQQQQQAAQQTAVATSTATPETTAAQPASMTIPVQQPTPGTQAGQSSTAYQTQSRAGSVRQTTGAAQQAGTPQRTEQAARVATSGYAADMGPILAAMSSQMTDPQPYADQLKQIDALLPQAIEEYRRTGRNPLADIVLAGMKPKRNEDEEERLRQNAKLLALNNVLSLIGRGIAASGGVRPGPIDNKPIYDIQNRLQRLDDIYRQEGERYDQNRLLAALRKDQANAQAAQNTVAELQNRRKAYVDLYADAVKNNREIAGKMADKALEASKYQAEVAFKEAAQREAQRHNRASEGLQWARYNSSKDKGTTKLRNYVTGQYADLTPELMADISGYVARIVHDRKSAGKDQYGNMIQGETPMPLNSRVTDEELKELQDGLNVGKLSPYQQGILTRLYNEMENGGLYDPENDTPFYMPSEPRSMYAEANRPEYENWLKAMLENGILSGRIKDNTITIEEARQLFPGLEQAPAKEVEKVLKNAGWQVIKQ